MDVTFLENQSHYPKTDIQGESESKQLEYHFWENLSSPSPIIHSTPFTLLNSSEFPTHELVSPARSPSDSPILEPISPARSSHLSFQNIPSPISNQSVPLSPSHSETELHTHHVQTQESEPSPGNSNESHEDLMIFAGLLH